MAMRWHDLLFAHWPVDPDAIRKTLPAGLELDLFDAKACVGVIPFRMSGVRARATPALPRLSAFCELNVRTYVRVLEKPGVYFYSLDAASRLAVATARRVFALRYLNATMSCQRDGDTIRYESRRTHRGTPPAHLRCAYRAMGEAFSTAPGTLEHWLTERYCLYAVRRTGTILRGEIDHQPWSLRRASCTFDSLDMTRLLDLDMQGPPASVMMSDRLDVVAWLPRRVGVSH